jgi:UDP-N-acetyl-2-amino-2-deoxyglucuronate dehydrogenase
MKNFVLIGAGGYIAPKHMQAIKDTGNNLLAAIDKHDSVGILDNYFPNCNFFTEFERFDRHIEKLKREGTSIDYVSICSPNHLHDAHIRFGLRIGADAICEKPIVLNPWNIDALAGNEEETKKKVYCIMQLRLHPTIIELRNTILENASNKKYNVKLNYITSRGNWYHTSWKGDIQKSGGIATNIGIHFFDMLQWIFGKVEKNNVDIHTMDTASGILHFKNAEVQWFLSIDSNYLPPSAKNANKTSFRNLEVNGVAIDFDEGFSNLHTKSYENVLSGKGFTLADAKPAIEIVHEIRKLSI